MADFDDIFAYADDILILTTDISTISRIILLIDSWSSNNNMKLNKGKSAIIEFLPPRSRRKYLKQPFKLGIPVLDKYKYLGLWLNNKITAADQIAHIKKKSLFISNKLFPLLRTSSLELRKNLWQTFIRPLFEFCLPLLASENS